jgi:hypothetical protein
MRFEHLVQINDPLNPLIDVVTRDALWRGLMHRVREPRAHLETIDEALIEDESPQRLRRTLRFGRMEVSDTVHLAPPDTIRIVSDGNNELPAGLLTMTIVEPGPLELFVRFAYETHSVPGSPPVDPFYEQFLKQAYLETDVASIRTIRRMLAEGELPPAE